MLRRQQIILSLLDKVGHPLRRTAFVKLVFLLREETAARQEDSFYDFVPYKYGPFSFVLYHELRRLLGDRHIVNRGGSLSISPSGRRLAWKSRDSRTDPIARGISYVAHHYGSEDVMPLLQDVYGRYEWYATRSEIKGLAKPSTSEVKPAPLAVYTAGYEGQSVDSFYNMLLRTGVRSVIDVRCNPLSRKYGFAKRRFSTTAKKLGIGYRHVPALGIPSGLRRDLGSEDSYQQLFDHFETKVLPHATEALTEVGDMLLDDPGVLVCMEREPARCHRSRVSAAVAKMTGLPVRHL